MKQFFLLIFLIFIFSCSNFFLTEKEIDCEFENIQYTFQADIKPIINQYCIQCHRSDFASGNLDLSEFSEFNISKYLIPGDTTQGAILNRINDPDNPMPPSWVGTMDQNSINIIKTWILECAVEN